MWKLVNMGIRVLWAKWSGSNSNVYTYKVKKTRTRFGLYGKYLLYHSFRINIRYLIDEIDIFDQYNITYFRHFRYNIKVVKNDVS